MQSLPLSSPIQGPPPLHHRRDWTPRTPPPDRCRTLVCKVPRHRPREPSQAQLPGSWRWESEGGSPVAWKPDCPMDPHHPHTQSSFSARQHSNILTPYIRKCVGSGPRVSHAGPGPGAQAAPWWARDDATLSPSPHAGTTPRPPMPMICWRRRAGASVPRCGGSWVSEDPQASAGGQGACVGMAWGPLGDSCALHHAPSIGFRMPGVACLLQGHQGPCRGEAAGPGEHELQPGVCVFV